MTYNINLPISIYPTNITKETIVELENYLELIELEESKESNNLLITSQNSADTHAFMNYLLDKISTKELN